MVNPSTTRLPVRHYELNAHKELPTSALFHKTAMRLTRAAGFGVEGSAERQTV